MSPEGRAFFVLFVLAGVGHAALFVRAMWKKGRCGLFSKLRCPWRKQPGAFDILVAEEVNVRICQTVKGGLNTTGAFWCLYALAVIAMPNSGGWLTDMQHVSMSIASMLGVPLRMCPERLLRRLLSPSYVACMLCLGGYVYFADLSSVFAALRSMAIANIVRIALSIAFCQVGAMFVCNFAMAVANTYIISSMQSDLGIQGGGALSVFAFECVQMGALVAFTWHRRSSLERECAQIVENRSLTIESSAMTALLSLVCDIVVELDDSLKVVEHKPSLSAMLGINRNTEGMELARYMSSDSDRESFESRLRGSSDSESSGCEPGALHVTLRDSMNNNIPVEIFYVVFQSSPTERSCFAGIREVADQPVARLPPSCLSSQVERALSASRDIRNLEKGTVPSMESQPLSLGDDGKSLEEGSRRSLNSAASRVKTVDDRFGVTNMNGKKLAILEMLRQWNVPVGAKACCPLHAELNELRSVSKLLVHTPCFQAFSLRGNGQCEKCGLVLDVENCGGAGGSHCSGAHLKRVGPREDRGASRHEQAASLARIEL